MLNSDMYTEFFYQAQNFSIRQSFKDTEDCICAKYYFTY